jgi:predicted phage tail protein
MFDFNRAIKLWEEYLEKKDIGVSRVIKIIDEQNNEKLCYNLGHRKSETVRIGVIITQQLTTLFISVKFIDINDKNSEISEFINIIENKMLMYIGTLNFIFNDDDQTLQCFDRNINTNNEDIVDTFDICMEGLIGDSKILATAICSLIDEHTTADIAAAVTLGFLRGEYEFHDINDYYELINVSCTKH